MISNDLIKEIEHDTPSKNQDILDSYPDMDIGLPWGLDNKLFQASVMRRAVDEDSRLIGRPNKNPLLDTRA